MRGQARGPSRGVRLTLPATSANLGPGFDAVGLALSLSLTVEAYPANEPRVQAEGRDAVMCGAVEGNLILESYLAAAKIADFDAVPLALTVNNEIPLGMGCGSSAAARLAGVALANFFGELGWSNAQIVAAASDLEGHPDNVAACWHGGFTVSVPYVGGIATANFPGCSKWQMILALPATGLSTESARAVLPGSYSRADAVFNLQRAALLTAAFAQERLDLLTVAMEDRLHQPQRRAVCALLEYLPALSARSEFAGVALSGAGPALLAILQAGAPLNGAERSLREILGESVELILVRIGEAARMEAL